MTHRADVARGRGGIARWCALAEQRLEHLTELFDTGRWRRFHSEIAFLENIQEAKAAVEIWQELLRRETTPGIATVDISWPKRAGPPLLGGEGCHNQIAKPQPRVAEEPARADVSIAPRGDLVGLDEA